MKKRSNKYKIRRICVVIILVVIVMNIIPKNLRIYFIDQTTPNMIQRISGIFERKPLISKEI